MNRFDSYREAHMGMLEGKKILVVGMASERSIAFGVAKALYEQGATLAFSYQNEKLAPRVKKMALQFESELAFPCDVAIDEEITGLFSRLSDKWDHLDGMVHSVAFAPADQLTGNFADNITREGFRIAHDISSYSLAGLAKAAHQTLMKKNGAIATMTYLGSTRAIPCYNTMGLAKASLEANVRYLAAGLGPDNIRVNAISAGPIRTLAASGIKDFKEMLAYTESVAPLRTNVTIAQVGNSTAFLMSDLASGITGEILHVDAGFHIMGMSETAQ